MIRARRTDLPLGADGEHSAFLLLILNATDLEKGPIDVKSFRHVGNCAVRPTHHEIDDSVEDVDHVHRIRCRHCRANYREVQKRCPECGAWRYNPFSDEVTLVFKVIAGIALATLLLWLIVRVDPGMPKSVKNSSLWLKAPLGLFGLAAVWALLDLLVKTVFRKR